MSIRRSTRRTAASAEPAPPALALSSQRLSSAVEPPRKKGRKTKPATPAAVRVESQSITQSRSTKANATSRATTASTTTTAATVVSKRTTRAAKAAGDGSPLRVYEPEKKRKFGRSQTTSASATPEPTPARNGANDDEDDDDEDDQGIFFTKTTDRLSPSPSESDHFFSLHDDSNVSPSQNDSEVAALKADNEALRNKNSQLEARVTELENTNLTLVNEKDRIVSTYDQLLDRITSLEAAQNNPPRSSLFTLPSSRSGPLYKRNVIGDHERSTPYATLSPSPKTSPLAASHTETVSALNTPTLSQLPQSTPTRFSPSGSAGFLHSASSRLSQSTFSGFSQPASPYVHRLPGFQNSIPSPGLPPVFKVDIPKHIDDMFAAAARGEYCSKTQKIIKTNKDKSGFDAHLRDLPTPSPARPMFVSGSESAMALLKKIEKSAEDSRQGGQSVTEEGSSLSDSDVTMQPAPQPQSTKRSFDDSATPARPIVPSSFFTRSFSAIKNIKSLFSTPAPAPKAPSPPRAAPPPNSLTETLSTPPTPVGERTKTVTKGPTMDRLTRTLLKGVDPAEERKAQEWARQIIPSLKNDKAFRAKRQRLQTPMLMKDLNNFPSAKPWETGFGDPLANLDDEDVVPVWAVYLDMVAEDEERAAKKHKTSHIGTMNFDDIPSINEQYAASEGARSTRRLFDSHGQSASDLDFHPRHSTVPSPMFDTSLSHHQGGNVFQELHGHDTAAKIRSDDREALQSAIKTSQNHNTDTGSFSVPDDSDEDDSTILSEAADTGSPAAPVWTQAPPPAPVPAHAPLPGGAAADASSTTSEKPVDEVERQRQKLMKHTPAKPSRLREATYPSPSLLSDAGNESIFMATPAQTAAAMNSIFNSMPGAEEIELDAEERAAFDEIVNSDAYKQQLAVPWAPAIISYDSDEDDLSPL